MSERANFRETRNGIFEFPDDIEYTIDIQGLGAKHFRAKKVKNANKNPSIMTMGSNTKLRSKYRAKRVSDNFYSYSLNKTGMDITVLSPSHNEVVEGIWGLSCTFVRMFTFCHHSSDLIYYPISIYLHTSIGYDNTSNEFAFQRDRIKVKVAVTIFFIKTLPSL